MVKDTFCFDTFLFGWLDFIFEYQSQVYVKKNHQDEKFKKIVRKNMYKLLKFEKHKFYFHKVKSTYSLDVEKQQIYQYMALKKNI